MCKHAKQAKCYGSVRVQGDPESYVLGSTPVIMGKYTHNYSMIYVTFALYFTA